MSPIVKRYTTELDAGSKPTCSRNGADASSGAGSPNGRKRWRTSPQEFGPPATGGFPNLLADPTDNHIHLSLSTHSFHTLPTTMASRTAVSRLANVASASKSLRPLSTAATSRLVSKNALASTAMARVSRSEGRMLVGDAARRYASSEEGGSTMVSDTGKQGEV